MKEDRGIYAVYYVGKYFKEKPSYSNFEPLRFFQENKDKIVNVKF